MKFSSRLTEAVFLKRVLRFLAEVVLPNRQKLMIRCPQIGEMKGSDVLGSKIWYSNAVGYNCLPTWELVEVDGGFLVSINPELMKPLIIDALKHNSIQELVGYNLLHAGGHYDQFRSQFLLLEKNNQQCYLGLEQVIQSDERGDGYFPMSLGDGIDNLQALIQAKEEGHQAILFYCVMHNGIKNIKPATHLDPEYYKLLLRAVALGVELLAYRVAINLEGIELIDPVPFNISEKVSYKS